MAEGNPVQTQFRAFRAMSRILPVVLLVAVAACRFPEDPEGTTDAVTGATMRVGMLSEPLAVPEQEAVARIAAALDARTQYIVGDAHSLLGDLKTGDIHVLAGGIPADTPLKSHVALSRPFGTVATADGSEDRVLAVRKGENRFLVAVNRSLPKVHQ